MLARRALSARRSVRLTLGGTRSISLSTEAILDRARHVAREMGADPTELYEPNFLVDACQQALVHWQDFLGDGALSIAAIAVLLRAATLPWNIRGLQKQCDRLVFAPVYMEHMKGIQEAQREAKFGVTSFARSSAQAEVTRLTEKYTEFVKSTGFTPFQGMGYQLMYLMPSYMLVYWSLRGVMYHPDNFRSLVVAPMLWADSPVLVDPWGLLPGLSALAVLANAEINGRQAVAADEKAKADQLYMLLVIRGATLAFVPLTSMLPAGMLVFMATNASYTAAAMWLYRRYYWSPPVLDPKWRARG